MHVNKKFKLWEASVQTWLFDERISGEIEWRPILQGKNGDWKQHLLIKSFLAGFDGGTLRLKDRAGKCSGAVNRGGRHWTPTKASQPAYGYKASWIPSRAAPTHM